MVEPRGRGIGVRERVPGYKIDCHTAPTIFTTYYFSTCFSTTHGSLLCQHYAYGAALYYANIMHMVVLSPLCATTTTPTILHHHTYHLLSPTSAKLFNVTIISLSPTGKSLLIKVSPVPFYYFRQYYLSTRPLLINSSLFTPFVIIDHLMVGWLGRSQLTLMVEGQGTMNQLEGLIKLPLVDFIKRINY